MIPETIRCPFFDPLSISCLDLVASGPCLPRIRPVIKQVAGERRAPEGNMATVLEADAEMTSRRLVVSQVEPEGRASVTHEAGDAGAAGRGCAAPRLEPLWPRRFALRSHREDFVTPEPFQFGDSVQPVEPAQGGVVAGLGGQLPEGQERFRAAPADQEFHQRQALAIERRHLTGTSRLLRGQGLDQRLMLLPTQPRDTIPPMKLAFAVRIRERGDPFIQPARRLFSLEAVGQHHVCQFVGQR